MQTNLEGFGNALSSRGASLNDTIADAAALPRHLDAGRRGAGRRPTTSSAGSSRRPATSRASSRPVADRYAHSFEAGADTFEAWSRYPDRLRAAIRNQAPTMRVGIQSFRVQRPFLADTARFSRALRGAAEVMPRTLPRITDALKTGIAGAAAAAGDEQRTSSELGALRDLAADDRTMYALRGVTRLVDIVNPLVRFVGPVRHGLQLLELLVDERVRAPDRARPDRRLAAHAAQPGAAHAGPDARRASARSAPRSRPTASRSSPASPMNLHGDVYTPAVDKNGNADCESGQRGYLEKLTHYNKDPNLKIVTDPRIPGNQGTTFTGRPKVPRARRSRARPRAARPSRASSTNPEPTLKQV